MILFCMHRMPLLDRNELAISWPKDSLWHKMAMGLELRYNVQKLMHFLHGQPALVNMPFYVPGYVHLHPQGQCSSFHGGQNEAGPRVIEFWNAHWITFGHCALLKHSHRSRKRWFGSDAVHCKASGNSLVGWKREPWFFIPNLRTCLFYAIRSVHRPAL